VIIIDQWIFRRAEKKRRKGKGLFLIATNKLFAIPTEKKKKKKKKRKNT
jgi:hypothetical protein